MTREEKEFQMCTAVCMATMRGSQLLEDFKYNWAAIYYKVSQDGWASVPDAWIDLLYEWMSTNYSYYFN